MFAYTCTPLYIFILFSLLDFFMLAFQAVEVDPVVVLVFIFLNRLIFGVLLARMVAAEHLLEVPVQVTFRSVMGLQKRES